MPNQPWRIAATKSRRGKWWNAVAAAGGCAGRAVRGHPPRPIHSRQRGRPHTGGPGSSRARRVPAARRGQDAAAPGAPYAGGQGVLGTGVPMSSWGTSYQPVRASARKPQAPLHCIASLPQHCIAPLHCIAAQATCTTARHCLQHTDAGRPPVERLVIEEYILDLLVTFDGHRCASRPGPAWPGLAWPGPVGLAWPGPVGLAWPGLAARLHTGAQASCPAADEPHWVRPLPRPAPRDPGNTWRTCPAATPA
jgi:hypothetical protein